MVSNEEITLSDTLKDLWYYFKGEIIKREYSHHSEGKKIIAGIESLPTLTYSDEVKQILKDKYGWVDVEELAKQYARKQCDDLYNKEGITGASWGWETALDFKEGFKAHQSITNKMFSLDDVENCWNEFVKIDDNIINNGSSSSFLVYLKQFLQQPIQLNVEIETEPYTVGEMSKLPLGTINQKPKITNNSILITKILE